MPHRKLEGHDVDRLVFPTCETHCETFVKSDDIVPLQKRCFIIGTDMEKWAQVVKNEGLKDGKPASID